MQYIELSPIASSIPATRGKGSATPDYEIRKVLVINPGPYTRAVRAGREIVPVVRACVEFYWSPGKIVFFGIYFSILT